MPRYLSALFLGLVVTAALAGDDEIVKRPYVEVGDCWTYHLDEPAPTSKQVTGTSEVCVTFVDQQKDLILVVSTESNGRDFDRVFTGEWNPIANGQNVFTKVPRWFEFPLYVGKTYSFEYEFHERRDGNESGSTKFDMKVVGWEEVTVPAGKFRALRIEGSGYRVRWPGESRRIPERDKRSATFWYVPAVNREVKSIFVNPNRGTFAQELTKYRLQK